MIRYIVAGAIIGSLITWVMNVPVEGGLILGAAVGGMSYMFGNRKTTKEEDGRETEMQLREEELEINKEREQTGEIDVRTDVIEEEKTIRIPVKRQEMVVEAGDEEELRIPLKEEQVEIEKQPVKLNEVSVSKRQVQEVEQIKETLKKEELDVDVEGTEDEFRAKDQGAEIEGNADPDQDNRFF
jgi:uncharacterized protein (TIGR02271 family)